MGTGRPSGRPPLGANTKQVCTRCKQNQAISKYYKSNNSLYQAKDGTFGICKSCIQEMTMNKDGTIDQKALKDILVMMNRPFLPKMLEEAIEEAKKRKKRDGTYGINPVAVYLKNVSRQKVEYVPMGYLDVMRDNQLDKEQYEKKMEKANVEDALGVSLNEENQDALAKMVADERKSAGDYLLDTYGKFEVTDEMRELFGLGFTMQEYVLMVKKYNTLVQSYPIKTAMHKEALINYVKYKVKEELAIADNDITSADKWGAMATKAAESAKLTPKQLTAADLQGGLSSFSEIFEAVEGATDVIDILPKFKQQPHDMADFIIWNYVNYERDLNNMPLVEYAEIYKFYDQRKEEYLKEHGDPFGIFTNDNTQDEKQRKTVQKFITVVEDGE